jgi:hypothetical protein
MIWDFSDFALFNENITSPAVPQSKNFHGIKKGRLPAPGSLSGGDVLDGSEALGVTNCHVVGDNAANAG